ncbi:acyl-ACP--UDP-N-acetylglucosamine O-acyltransferase [Synergistaceae bacterium OttesenSCG-928-I11]|nr:acyl-ACP--UDP-N-acetylglucosamine O-acyltransferase [Synergistaceae bacterium OttesenSCG-928-I11]
MEDFIHPTAIVSPDAKLGWGVKVGPYSVIEAGSSIGDGTKIEAFVRIKQGVTIGRNCHIFENATLGSIPQDHDFGGEVSYVRIEDDVVIRENVTVNRATGEGLETFVGSGTMIMEGCHLGHNVRIGEHCTVANKVGFSGHVEAGDYVVVGGLTGFHQFVKIGSYAMVGGLAKVTKDIPPYSMVDGHPARVYGLNVIGLRRRGFSQEQRTKIKNIYRLLYDRHMRRTEAVAAVESRYGGDEHGAVIVAFLKSLKRGLTPWMSRDGHRAGEAE